MSTYYHFRGFIYGPCTQLKPERKPEWNPYQWDSWFGLFTEYTMQKPKYKWTGPPLEDWKEMIEGKDFRLKNELSTGNSHTWQDDWDKEEQGEVNEECETIAIPINQ